MTARFPPASSIVAESDPVYAAAAAGLAAAIAAKASAADVAAADAVIADEIEAVLAALEGKADVATAATDADVVAAIAAHAAGDATDAELAAAVSQINLETAAALAMKQDTASTPFALAGVGAPIDPAPNGSTYIERDLAGQAVAIWLREAGAWEKQFGPPGLTKVARLATQELATTNFEPVIWDTIAELSSDFEVEYPGGSGVICQRAGVYLVGAQATYLANTSGAYRQALLLNGGLTGELLDGDSGPALSIANYLTFGGPVRLEYGDELEIHCRSNGTALTDGRRFSASLALAYLGP